MRNPDLNFFNERESRVFFQKAKSLDYLRHHTRNLAIFYVAYYCALRASEVGMIRTDDFTPDTRTIYCRRLKGGQNNSLFIVDNDVFYALKEYYDLRINMETDSPYLFLSQKNKPISRQSLDRIIKKYASYCNIPQEKQHMHVLRHSRAIDLAEHGADIKDIQYWLGHQNIHNTMIYHQYTVVQMFALYQLLTDQRSKKEELLNMVHKKNFKVI